MGINTAVGAALIMCACVWSTVGPAISVAGAFSSLQIAVGEGMAEVMENVSVNWALILEKLSETSK